MLKKKFDLYLNLIFLPVFVTGLAFVFLPSAFLNFIFKEAALSDALLFMTRFFFLSQVILGITLFSAKSNLSGSRSLIFWISVYFLIQGVFFLAGIYLYGLKIIAALPAVFLLISGGFLLAYASRNILVRE